MDANVTAGGVSCADLPQPDSVVATRPDASSPWHIGAERSVAHLHWRIRTVEDGTLRKGHTSTVRFDSMIAAGMRLNHPDLAIDRRMKTELCLDALSPISRAGQLSASTLSKRLLNFDVLIRWRWHERIPAFSALDANDLHRFLRQTQIGELCGSNDRSFRAVTDATPETEPAAVFWLPAGTVAVGARVEEELERWSSTSSPSNSSMPPSDRCSVSEKTITGYLAVWSWLHRASATGVLGTDRLMFDPCPDGSSSRLASAYGTQGARTPTLAPAQFLRVLGASCEWIEREGPPVLALMSAVPGMDECPSGGIARRVSPTGVDREAEEAGLAVRVRHLMAACATVIGGFAARRGGEVGSLKAGCIKRRRNGLWISIYIEKTDRAACLIPVPESVALAVETLERLSLGYRLRTGEPWILNALLPGCEKPLSFLSDTDLPAFALACGLHSGPHALTSPLASHQLRRGFSIAFYHAFRLGSLPALRRMLRHADDASARIYVSEATPGGTLRLADDLRARFHAALKAMPPGRQVAVSAELERLETLAASGAPLDRLRCENAALLLLQAWRRDLPSPERPEADETQAVERRAVAGIRIGSQLATGPSHPISLLDRARAYVRRVLVR